MQNLLYIFLIGPTLLAAYYWYVEEYRYTGNKLSLQQLFFLSVFMGYVMYCSSHGAGGMLALYNDYSYQAGRALSFTGLWTFIIPGMLGTILIFPKQTLLYLLRKASASSLQQTGLETFGWSVALLILIRHAAVI